MTQPTILGVALDERGRAETPLGLVFLSPECGPGRRAVYWTPPGVLSGACLAEKATEAEAIAAADLVLRALWDAARADLVTQAIDRLNAEVLAAAERKDRAAGLREAAARAESIDTKLVAVGLRCVDACVEGELRTATQREGAVVMRAFAKWLRDRADAIERGEP